MPKESQRSFLGRIRDALPHLRPAERRLGELLCDFPGELASYSATELAGLANVSNATVTRFVKRLGYANFEAARRHAREEKRTGSRLFLERSRGDARTHSVSSHIEQSRENLSRTFAAIPNAEIDAIAKAILKARKVWVIGFRASHAFATYLQWQTTQVLENIVAIPGGGETLGEYLASVDSADLVIVFGLRRRVSRMKAIVTEIKKSGASFLYITDEGAASPKGADWHIRCHTLAPGPLFNHVAVMGVCHVLATRAIELAGVAARKRLTRIEVVNDALSEL